MKIVLISPSKKHEDEAIVVTSLFEAGLGTYHIRKPKQSTRQVRELIEQFPVHFHKNIVIHSHHQLARKFNLKGIHFTRTHLKRKIETWFTLKLLSLKKQAVTVSVSHTKLSSIYEEDLIHVDYCFLSPIFDSLTGKYQSGFYDQGITAAIKKSGKNVVARGGVDISRLEKIDELGFYGAALYSCIWDSKEPLQEYIKIIKRCKELNIEVE